ncbi:uncharacterized protein LOC110992302 isoform X2 [Pieris rapae]|nr:uncharacterized protein LOC110992302 isoform X2 [Pieris rapae]
MLKDGASNSDSLAECRACLQLCSNKEQHNLFKCWDPPWAGMENTPAEDLSKLACVQISQTDTHSKILCQSCYTHLQNACQFVEIVKKADEVLSLRIGVNNPHTPDSWPKPIQVDKNVPYDKVQIKDEIFSDEETQQINEEDFSNVDVKIEADDWPSQSVHINGIISLGQLNKEMAEINGYLPDVEQNGKINGLTSEEPITNGVVNYKHDKADSFNTNCLVVSVKDEPVSDDESETNASELPLDCILCCKTFSSLTGLKAHVIAQHSYKVLRRKTIDDAQESLLKNVCKICKRRFETSTDLMVHETCHNMCVCYGCNTSFETFDQLSQHRQSCMAHKNSEVGKVLKLEDVQRMANIAQRILEVITKFTIFSQNSEHGNIDECYQALLAVITQKEDSICDDLSCNYDDLCSLSDLESYDDTLLEYNKHFLSDLHLQKKSSKLIESSVLEHNITSQSDDDFNSMEHSVKAIGKLLSYPVVKITRLESPILQNNKSSHLYDSDPTSSYEDFEELDEFLLDSEELLISSHKRADGVEKQMAKENENQLILSNSEFSTEIDTSKDVILHPDINDIHEKSLSSSFLLFNASNSITEEENIDSLDFDDDDDEFHADNVSVCLDILSKYFPDETENDENFAKSSTQTLSKVAFKSSFPINVANTHLNPVANDEIINIIDESNDIDNFKKPCIVGSTNKLISVNINTSISQIPQKNTTDIASRALTLFNMSEPRVIENASTTPLSLSSDKTINYICQKPLTTRALKSNIVNEHCSDVLIKQTGTEEMNLRNFNKLPANETREIEKHRIKNKSHVIATDVKISENNSKLQTAKLSKSIVGCENEVIGSDICKDKKASSRELPSSVTCDTNSQTFQPLPRLVGVNNKFIFRYRSTRKMRRGCKMDCKFRCRKIFTSHLRYNKFKDFWKMDLSAQSKFLDDNVVKKIPRKLPRNRFFLPNSNESVRVCRKFIEDTFSILMLSYRKEFKKCKLTCDDYYFNVGKKDTKVLDCCNKQTLSECVSSINLFKENKTNSNGDTKQLDVIKKSNNIAQSNYGAEKCSISSIHRNIKSNVSNGDTPYVHCSMKNDHRRLVDKTGSEINKNMRELNLKICSKKSKVESSTCSNEYASGASNIKKRYRYNNITINVSTSDKVSFSRSNPYVKLIDIGFYTQLHSSNNPETSSTNSTQTHSQLVKNIDFSNIVDPSPSYQSDKNNLSHRIDTDLDIPNNDSNSQGLLENEVKTNFSHSPFDDLTAKDINCQSILHDKLKSEMANENQQIPNAHTNCQTLLHDEIKTKTLPLVIEKFQASDEESNSQSILQNEIESNLYLSNNINSEITNNYSSSYNIDGHDYCSSVKDLPKSYVKSNKQNTTEDHLPLLNLPKITKYQVSKCHTRDNIDDNFPHLPAEDLVPSNEGSNLQDQMMTKPLLVNLNPQCTEEDSKCNDMTNHIIQLSGKDFSNEKSRNEQSMTGEIEHNDYSSYHSDSARDIIDHHLPCLPIEHLAPSNEGSNLQHEKVNKLPLSLNPNPQYTNVDSRCNDTQNHIMRLSGGDLSNEESENQQSMTGEIEHNDYSSYHSDSARDLIDVHLPLLPPINLVPCNEVINLQNEMENKLPLLLNPNPQCTNEDSRHIQNHIMRLSDKDLSNEETENQQSMTGEINHNEHGSYHSDSARDINDDHLPLLPTIDLVPCNEVINLQNQMENKLPLVLNPNPQCTNEDSRCNDTQNNIIRLSGGDLSNEESENKQSMTGEIEHYDDNSYHSDIARNIIDDHLPPLPIEHFAPSNEGSNLQHEMENKPPLVLNPNPQCTNEDSRCNDTQNNIIRLSGGGLSNEESENQQSMTGEIEHSEDSSYHSGSARDINDDHLPLLPTIDLVPYNEVINLQNEMENKPPLVLNPNPQCTNEDSRCNDTHINIIRLSGGDLSNEESENQQSMTGEIEHSEDSSYHSGSARDINDDHLPLLPTIDLVPYNEVINLQNEMENKPPLLLNPNPQSTNEDNRPNDMARHIMLLPDKHVFNEESKNEQSMAGEIEHNEGSSCHSIRQDLIKNHLPHISNENLLKSSDESSGRTLQNDIINKLPLSSNMQITNADAFCEVLCDSRIEHEDSNGQNIIYPLNDDRQNYNRASPRPTIGEETTIQTLTHTFHTDTHVCYENDPKIAKDFNSSTIFDYTNTNLQIDNKDIIQQQNVKTNLSHLTITNSLTYNNTGNGESYCYYHSSPNVLESQISIDESNSSQMSLKFSVLENTPEIDFEGLFHPQSQSLIDGKINLKQHYRKKSNHFKLQRIIGKGYKFIFRYKVTRSLRPGCQHCIYKCTQAIGFDQRRVLFENFWKMDVLAQTSYLNEHVFLINPILGLHDINETRMKRNHKFFFTVYGKRFRVCKKFFLNTLSILMADLENDSSRLKVIRERLNPNVKLIDIGFHKEPQRAIEVVSCVSNHTSSVETFGPGSWNASLDSYSKLDMHSPHTKIKLPENVRLEAVNVDDFQSNSSDSQSQSPVYAELSTVDQYYDKEIVSNVCSLNAEPCDKNTHLMKPHEINSIRPFITNVTQANKEEQSFKAILNNWSKPQDPLDKQRRAPFKCTTNYNQISSKNCTHTTYIQTKSDSFQEIDDELKNMDILYESSLDSANTSLLDLRQTITVPNFLDCDDHINKVAFGTKSYERSDTELFLKDSQIQNASSLSSLSSAETNPGVKSQTEIPEDKVIDGLQLSTQNVCAVSELSKNIDSVLIATAQHDINSALNQSEWQLGHRERGNIITTTAVTNLLPTFTNSINNETTKLTNSVYGLDKITIDPNTSVINIDEEKPQDTTEKDTNVIQDNTDLNEQQNLNQPCVTSDIAMESFKCSTLNIEISNQTNKFPSNTDSLATETDGVVTPIPDKNNLNNGVTLLSDLVVQNQNYYNTKDNPCSSPKETSFTYTDSCNSSSEYLESKEMQLINDNRLKSDYAQLSNVYEPPCIDSYLITKNTYYEFQIQV